MKGSTHGTAVFVASALGLVTLALVLNGYPADLFKKWLIYCCLAMSFHFLFGVSGQIAFSHGVFFGVGAYAVVILTAKLGWPVPLAMLAAMLASFGIAFMIAVPTVRLEGFYLALATMALGQLFEVVLVQGGALTGGADGLYGFGSPTIAGLPLTGSAYAVLLVCLFLAVFALIARLNASSFGRVCRAVRDNPAAAAAMGIDVGRTRIIAFTVASLVASITGIAYAFLDNYVSPYVFGLDTAFLVFFMVVIGGSDRLAGALIGATVLFLAPEFIGEFVSRGHKLIFGILMILAIVYKPAGLVGMLPKIPGSGPGVGGK